MCVLLVEWLGECFLYVDLAKHYFGESFVMLFLQISRHAPESCPMHNEKVKKATLDLMAKMEPLMKKHGIKMVGCWNSMSEHLVVVVYDAPSFEVLLKFSMEPEAMVWSSYQMTETMPVVTLEEAMKMLK